MQIFDKEFWQLLAYMQNFMIDNLKIFVFLAPYKKII